MDDEAAIVVVEQSNLLAAKDGKQLVERATERATALAEVIRKQKLSTTISGREHVRVEGWTLLGSMMGVFPVTDWVHELRGEDGRLVGFEARVEAKTLAGATVGAAVARCMYDERNWNDRDQYALSSMAQTRATAKALRMPLGFVMQLAGFDPTPAEEIPRGTPTAPAEPADPRGDAWRRTREAIERGVPKDVAESIAEALGADVKTAEGAVAVADAVERFEQTGELPGVVVEPQEGTEEEPEPLGDPMDLAARIRGAMLVAGLSDEANRETERTVLLNAAADIIEEHHWQDDDIRAILGSRKKNVAKALLDLIDDDLRLAVQGIEDAHKAVTG